MLCVCVCEVQAGRLFVRGRSVGGLGDGRITHTTTDECMLAELSVGLLRGFCCEFRAVREKTSPSPKFEVRCNRQDAQQESPDIEVRFRVLLTLLLTWRRALSKMLPDNFVSLSPSL